MESPTPSQHATGMTASLSRKKACVQCTTAKAKCTPASSIVCERCLRLGKDCEYLEVVEKKRKLRDTR